jgi:HSP20 family protein
MLGTLDTIRELQALRREVERALEDFSLGEWTFPFSRVSFLPGLAGFAYPLMNIREDDNNIYVEALAPGLDKDNIEISVMGDSLRIAGEKLPVRGDIQPGAYHRNERSAAKFVRTIDLNTDVDRDKVSAEYKNGILLVTLPKTERSRAKQITVKVD